MPKKLTIEEMQELAKARGGKCLSKKYIGSQTKHQWECAEGHKWWAKPNAIKQGHTWCNKCAEKGTPRLTIEEMQELAKARGGKCLSKKYIGSKTKHQWECAEGHRWWAIPVSIKNSGTWCRKCYCAKKIIGTIQEMQELAKSKGGKCLSNEYLTVQKKLEWECAKGHRWWTTPHNIKNHGQWCLKCYGREKKTIEDMQALAKEKGGKCLSTKYKNSNTRLKWRCDKGHEWWTTPSSITQGSWCLKCYGKEKGTIEEMQELAKSKGGSCLSKIYINARTPLKWRCDKGHTWETTYCNVQNNLYFCQYCRREEQLEIKMRKQRQKKARPFKMRGGQIDG